MQRVTLGDRLAFDKAAYAIDVNDRRHIRFRDGHPSIGLMLEQPLTGQDPERFSQGVAGNLQGFGQGRFRQPLARSQFTFDQHSADLLGNGFSQRARKGR
ncbi:hypothetical protein D3C86_1828660 [compost metagenome]